MKKTTKGLLPLFLFFLTACQQEIFFEPASVGTLKTNSGECLPKTFKGTYRAGESLVDTSQLFVQLTVYQRGTYKFSTDTVNGVYFAAKGEFVNEGTGNVLLWGHGTPTNPGTFIMNLKYNKTSGCKVPFTVVP